MPWMTLAAFYVLVSRVREAAGLRLLQDDNEGLNAVEELKGDEYLHAWECGYDEDGCWDDARAARALRTTREERENAKKAEAERKRSAARAQQAARRTAARPPPAPREAGQLDDAATRPAARQQRSRPQTGSKRVYTCSVCRCQGHSAKRKEGVAQCPRQQAAAAAAAAAAACDE